MLSVLNRVKRYGSLLEAAKAHESTLTPASVLRKTLRIRSKNASIGMEDYFAFRLYDEGFLKASEPHDFVGWRWAEPFSTALNPRTEVLPAWDKIVFHALADRFDIPTPTVVAVVNAARPSSLRGIPHFSNEQELIEFLRDSDSYPIFCKPVYSQQGIGAFRIDRYDSGSDSLEIAGDGAVLVTDLAKKLLSQTGGEYLRGSRGYLLQKPVRQHCDIVALTANEAVSSFRVVVLNWNSSPRIHRVLWKCAVPPNVIDNFSSGKNGNLVADVCEGRIHGAVNGIWPFGDVLQKHPVTGSVFSDVELPHWTMLETLALRTCDAFPGFGVLHLDVVIGEDGPVILELNDIGGTGGHQLMGRGLLADGGKEFLKERGDRRIAPWIDTL